MVPTIEQRVDGLVAQDERRQRFDTDLFVEFDIGEDGMHSPSLAEH